MGKTLVTYGYTTGATNNSRAAVVGARATFGLESQAQLYVTDDCTFSDLRYRISSGGSGSNTSRFRVNAADGNLVATRSGIGVASDLSNSDAVSVADLVAILQTDTGTNPVYLWRTLNVEFDSEHGGYWGAYGNGSFFAAGTYYTALNGEIRSNFASEAQAQVRVRGYDELSSMFANVASNSWTATITVKSRVNGADAGASIAIGSGLTGMFTDLDFDEALSSGDLVCASIEIPSGSGSVIMSIGATLKSSFGASDFTSAFFPEARTASGTPTAYIPVSDAITNSTESNLRVTPGFEADCGNLRIYVSANAYTGTATLNFLVGGTSRISQAIGAGLTGWFENTSDTYGISDTDEISFNLDDGTANSLSFTSLGVSFFLPPPEGDYAITPAVAASFVGQSVKPAVFSVSAGAAIAYIGQAVKDAVFTISADVALDFEGSAEQINSGAFAVVGEAAFDLIGSSTAESVFVSSPELVNDLLGNATAIGVFVSQAEAALAFSGTGLIPSVFSSASEALFELQGSVISESVLAVDLELSSALIGQAMNFQSGAFTVIASLTLDFEGVEFHPYCFNEELSASGVWAKENPAGVAFSKESPITSTFLKEDEKTC